MKYLGRTLLFSILLVFPLQATADDWNKYLNATDRFYSLDKQEFTSISCTIEVPVTRNQVKQLHAQFEPLKSKLEMKENLADFSLRYGKKEGLTISYPSFDIKIISEEGMADPAKVKQGIETIKAGFKQQVEGAGMQLQGLFEGLETPKKNRYKITEINDDKATYTATYEKDNSTFTETFAHLRRNVKQVSRNGEEKSSSVENYKNTANNKLLLTDAQAVINNTMGNIEITMTISYEKVKDVLFPTHLESLFKQTMQTIKQEGQIDIYLKNCTLR